MLSSNPGPLMMDRRWKTNIETAPNCPRCASTNTKFCYYNNYSLSQPRYFCKGCRRYWTKGGSLRNVPHGGACRKSRRAKSVRLPPPPPAAFERSYGITGANSSSDDSSNDSFTAKSGSDIDLALVFSKFLNNNNNQDSSSSSSSYSPGSDSGFVIPEIPIPYYDPVVEAIHQQQNHPILGFEDAPAFVPEVDSGMDGLQAMLCDGGMSQDIFWSETTPTPLDLPNFSWQHQQLQEFEGVMMMDDDQHSNFHNNVLNGNWNSFDITPSYGA